MDGASCASIGDAEIDEEDLVLSVVYGFSELGFEEHLLGGDELASEYRELEVVAVPAQDLEHLA